MKLNRWYHGKTEVVDRLVTEADSAEVVMVEIEAVTEVVIVEVEEMTAEAIVAEEIGNNFLLKATLQKQIDAPETGVVLLRLGMH